MPGLGGCPLKIGHFWISFKKFPDGHEDGNRHHFDAYDDGVIVPSYRYKYNAVQKNDDRDFRDAFTGFISDPLLDQCVFYPLLEDEFQGFVKSYPPQKQRGQLCPSKPKKKN